MAKRITKADINDILRGAYNEEGIQSWWNRPRSSLNGMSPNEAWKSMGPEYVLLEAVFLKDAGAT